MSVTIVVGAQYGGEGKGKIVAHLTRRDNPEFVVRCGGPNSGHTVQLGDRTYKLRMLPAGFINPSSRLLLAAGSVINLDLLLAEIDLVGIDKCRVGIDRNAITITGIEGQKESELGLREQIGSTLSGTGVAVANRVLRNTGVRLAKDIPKAKPFITDVSMEVNEGIDRGNLCIVEGTQGFGLSLYHTLCYPYATSRDTTASAFLSEVGISPMKVSSIIMAVRTFPIRVEGNSGPLKSEITWEELQQTSGYPYPIHEFSTVTQKVRRVAKLDLTLIRRSALVNCPTELALHGADYIDFRNKGVSTYAELTETVKDIVNRIEAEIGTPITLIGTGPGQNEIVDRNKECSFIGLPGRSRNDFS